jgi:hypothetical protein
MMSDRSDAGLASLHDLEDSVHSLAQPITALVFAIEMAYLHAPTETIRESLVAARTECRRAMDMVDKVRGCTFRVREDMTACGRM